MARLTKLQRLLLEFIEKQGGEHVYISRSLVPPGESGLRGYTWEGVNLSLRSMVNRGLLHVVKDSFFYLEKQGVSSILL